MAHEQLTVFFELLASRVTLKRLDRISREKVNQIRTESRNGTNS